MDKMTHAKFHFNRLMLTLIFGIRASGSLLAWRTTEKSGPDRVNTGGYTLFQVSTRVEPLAPSFQAFLWMALVIPSGRAGEHVLK